MEPGCWNFTSTPSFLTQPGTSSLVVGSLSTQSPAISKSLLGTGNTYIVVATPQQVQPSGGSSSGQVAHSVQLGTVSNSGAATFVPLPGVNAQQQQNPQYRAVKVEPGQAQNLPQPNAPVRQVKLEAIQLPQQFRQPIAQTPPQSYAVPPQHNYAATMPTHVQQPPMQVRALVTNGVHSGQPLQTSLQSYSRTAAAPPPQQAQPAGSSASQMLNKMTPDQRMRKCATFLNTLITLARKKESEKSADFPNPSSNVTRLIQNLIDDVLSARSFTEELERILKSAPQPHLIGFLEESLTDLRAALLSGEQRIEGIRPPMSFRFANNNNNASLNSQVHFLTNGGGGRQVFLQQQMQPSSGTAPPPAMTSFSFTSATPQAVTTAPSTSAIVDSVVSSVVKTKVSKGRPPKSAKQKPLTPGGPDKYKDLADDDINDVAAMGGVNLAEESQKILASTAELLSTEARTCRDEYFLSTAPLLQRIAKAAKKHGLEDTPSAPVAYLISHALQERLKDTVEKLSVIVEHRLDPIKAKRNYEQVSHTRAQLNFLMDLERIEKQKNEEREKEALFRMAKSRSKGENAEQKKIKEKAKELQKAEQDELRNRDANMAAELALRPRKKAKWEESAGPSTSTAISAVVDGVAESRRLGGEPSHSATDGSLASGFSVFKSAQAMRPTTKRVNLRDLQFLLLQEKDYLRRSPQLFRTFFGR